MKKITIKRKSEWQNRKRKIAIYVDDEKVGTIDNGEIKEFELKEGKHKIKAKIDWYGSKEFDFELSENFKGYFEVSGFKNGNVVNILLLVLMFLYFILNILSRQQSLSFNTKYILIPLIPLFLYYLYYISLGKNKYLELHLKK